ncbi:hypothetical protein POJ06DRAFT_281064 [Lipomyces tetrasporus]|uniref:Protein YIP n=1 Tax=Lipomyces tetrasporus TaxID=54092 RepID=A0AAD7VTP7_9ASCO|nr:uncharacterized protein POJ06DRAFT_281064 [Lipomyces tetrasporus]KAJ8101201.1 hypothetical protein POJ06DRAFT_281064 [Lipomyces tetrasporus]
MAGSTAAANPPPRGDYDTLIDVDAEGVDLGETDLEFHDFHTGDNIHGKIPAGQHRLYEPPSALENDPNRPVSIWTVHFYAQFFNVETSDVLQRCLYALYPRVSFVDTVGDNPDLYGPFWIASTVILVLFFSSTLAGAIASHVAGMRYEYNFALLSAAAALMYGYTFIVPIVLWGVLKWYRSEHARLLECVTLYGYANTIWVPVALVSISPIEIFNFPTVSNVVRWVSAAVGFAVSTTFLVRNLYPVLNSTEAKTSRILLVGVVLAHMALAFVVKLVFFA